MVITQIDPAHQLSRRDGRAAVVDIGSNSVRLVVYNHLGRAPQPVFNERVICGIGRGIATTGRLDSEGVARALANLARFARLIDAMAVVSVDVIATAATREAADGAEFLARVAAIFAIAPRQLDGESEARLAAMGVAMGIPDADGLVGDLGGGSLEFAGLDNGRVGAAVSLPLGPLRLVDTLGASLREQRAYIDRQLASVDWLAGHGGRNFYPVGGAWRTLARLHMAQSHYPLRVIHHYEISGRAAADFAKLMSRQSAASLRALADVPSPRTSVLPMAALVMRRVLKALRPEVVIFSATGLREGLLYDRLGEAERAADPLIRACAIVAERESRFGNRGDALFAWTAPLFDDETAPAARLRYAACLLADIGWLEHPDYRAEQVYYRILRLPLTGIDHRARAELALAVHARYGGTGEDGELRLVEHYLDDDARRHAKALGAALRLAETLVGGMTDLLADTRLSCDARTLQLELGATAADLNGEVAQARFAALARLLDRTPQWA
jgi:exopolyphosphatase/guanosine-5'-triphosphate,3'-diphosphate pyrophosphatase